MAGFRLKWEVLTNLDILEQRVGTGYFSWMQVQDIFHSPAKLKSMKSQGLVQEVGVIKKSNSCIWKISFEGRRRLSSFRGDGKLVASTPSGNSRYFHWNPSPHRFKFSNIPHGTEVNHERDTSD